MHGKRDMASPYNSSHRLHRKGASRLRLILQPIFNLDLYPEMLLYHYAMDLWHHHGGAKYQDQRPLRVYCVEKKRLEPKRCRIVLECRRGDLRGPSV